VLVGEPAGVVVLLMAQGVLPVTVLKECPANVLQVSSRSVLQVTALKLLCCTHLPSFPLLSNFDVFPVKVVPYPSTPQQRRLQQTCSPVEIARRHNTNQFYGTLQCGMSGSARAAAQEFNPLVLHHVKCTAAAAALTAAVLPVAGCAAVVVVGVPP